MSPESTSGSPARGRGGYRPESQLVTRPASQTDATGADGRPVSLFANFFKVETDASCSVWDYRVDFDPDVESVKVRRKLVDGFANNFTNAAGRPAFVFDGMSNLKSLRQLDPERLDVTLETVNQAAAAAGDPAPPQRITFRRSEEPVAWGSFEMMRLYNSQMRRNFQHLEWMLIFRNFYDPTTRISMQQFSIDVMLGLATAINQHDGGILMACDAINKIIRKDTVLMMMKQIYNRGGNFQDNCRRELVGSIVMTLYNNRTYKIDDIDFVQNPDSTFDRRGRGHVSFVNYYKEQYQQNITDTRQPLIVCLPSIRDKRAAEQRHQTATTHLLIPEFCVMTGLSESLRNDFNLKKQLTQSTQLPPPDRYKQLRAFRQKLQDNANVQSDLSTWNMRYSAELVSLPGRVMDNERLLMSGNMPPTGVQLQNPGDFAKEMRAYRMLVAREWKDWIVLHTARDGPAVDLFLEKMRQVSAGLGLKLSPPKRASLSDDRTVTYLAQLREWAEPEKPDGMVVCVFPNNNGERYSAVKKQCCIEKPCASQCVLTRTMSNEKTLMSVATKICLQMACKAGSEAWGMVLPAKNIAVVGYDTYHDSTRRGESVGAFVCSLNAGLSQFFSRVSYHRDRAEMSNNMEANMRLALCEYEKRMGSLPARVVIFRDGVGEGMLRHVFEVEVERIRNALRDAGSGIQLAFVVVTKRMSVKFFEKNEQLRVLTNPQPGTVVDQVVTRPERLEFYLVSQSVRAGTVAPTSYNIICNEVGWLPKHFQMLSYKLCHMYYNWPGTIRVPAPCQYAHKLAHLTGTALHREPNAALSDRLFFL